MLFIGYDIGSSSIKAALIDAASGQIIKVDSLPKTEMSIAAPQQSWAEQDPEMWWRYICELTKSIIADSGKAADKIKGVGISYQMHGLVTVNKQLESIRPAIIWCDSRAVEIGQEAFDAIGQDIALEKLLNSPGNFTASKLGWVKANEPTQFNQVHKFMLPGDYVAMRLTGDLTTTSTGLSEGIFWDFKANGLSEMVMNHFGFDQSLVPDLVPIFGEQGKVSKVAAEATGLPEGIPVAYRAGDQPNNALSLNVLHPGDIAATAGTSGVIYGVMDKPVSDAASRVNGFVHVNHLPDQPRIGVLLCINGAGIQYNWLRQQFGGGRSYEAMSQAAALIPIGSDGITILPFGNGAERMLENKDIGAHIDFVNFNRHTNDHLIRAALEGIAFAFVYGAQILKEMGLQIGHLKVGNDNMFRSSVFSTTIATLLNCKIDVIETTGAVGAAKGAAYGTGYFDSLEEAMRLQHIVESYEPVTKDAQAMIEAYERWKTVLAKYLQAQ